MGRVVKLAATARKREKRGRLHVLEKQAAFLERIAECLEYFVEREPGEATVEGRELAHIRQILAGIAANIARMVGR